MEIILAATRTCHHRPILESEFKKNGVSYQVRYFEDHPEMVESLGYKESPVVIVDGEVRFRGMPEITELHRFVEELNEDEDRSKPVR